MQVIIRSEPSKAPLKYTGDQRADAVTFVHDGEGQ